MNLIPVLQANGTTQTVALSLPGEEYVKEVLGRQLWYFRFTNEGVEELYLSEDMWSRSYYKSSSSMYKTLAANFYKKHYQSCPMSEFMEVKQFVITYQETL